MHAWSFATILPVTRLLRIVDSADNRYVAIRWNGVPAPEHTWEPLRQIYGDICRLLINLIKT